MKTFRLFLLCASCALALQAQPAPPSPVVPVPATPADADYAAFQTVVKEKAPGNSEVMGRENYLTWLDLHRQKVTATGLAFYAAYPGDARRWDVVLEVSRKEPFFAKSYGPDVATKGRAAAIVDEAAKAVWEQNIAKLKRALLDSTDAPAVARARVEFEQFALDFQAITAAREKGGNVDYHAMRPRFDAIVAKYPTVDDLAYYADSYLGALEKYIPGSTEEIWKQMLVAPNAALRAEAAERLKFFDLIREPLDIAFTAADGRSVDLKNLRGKVVLVDFWATWCGPCKAELPNVVANYQKYHDKGFEVVGISLEDGKLLPKDTPEQTAAKLETAKKILTDFTASNDMPWPQYFDGKFWKNDLSTKYAISGIPAMFLLDQDGKVVSTNARGAKLEAEVKRLLKL